MSKKILFLSSAKLTAISIGLLLAVFCTIGMSFTPAEEGDNVGNPNDSTYVSGPRRGHSTNACTGKETNTNDYAKTIAVSLGNGTVYVSTSQTERIGQTGTTGTPGEANSTSYITWNCGAVKANDTQIKYCWAIPKTGYHFLKWTKNSDGSGSTSTENPYSFSVTAASENESSPTEGKIYAVFEANPTYTATFKVATNGSYTYQYGTNAAVTVTTEQSVTTNMNFALTATPASGYKVFGWYTLSGTTKTYFEYLSTSVPSYALEGNTTIGVDFVPSSLALFTIKGTSSVYADLNEAATAAASSSSKIVVPTSNGTVPAGNYTIPANVTLLIPFDAAYTCYTTTPEDPCVAPSGLGVFRKLTLANNAKITVANKGAISVSAMSQGGQPYGGSVHGKYGQIDMKAGSTITLQDGASLYCWGYITGAGEITAQSGSKVYEDFQVACWRGGSAASGMVNNEKKVFPLAQYYIQNIEAKTIFNAGALEYAFTSVSINSTSTSTTAQIVGTTSGLFQISSGTLTKWYNYTDDRQMYQLEGNAALGTVQISVSVSFVSADIKSQDYVLPLTNNMNITVKSGTMSCNQKIAILPGAKIVVNEGANVSLGTDSELYVYDKDEWPNDGTTAFNYPNVAFKKVNYTPSTITTPRTYANMNDAVMDINGTLTTGSGHFYTTQGKANICSSNGTGKVIWKKAPASGTPAAGSKDYTYQATQSGTSISYTSIPITPAQLHNDETLYPSPYNYTATAGTAASTTIEYHHGHWGWATIWVDTDGSTILHRELGQNQPQANYTYTPESGYEFDGWSTTTDDTNKETVHKATVHPLITQYTITVLSDGNGTVSGGGTFDENSVQSISATANTGYHFDHWNDGNTNNPRSITITGNITYTATFAPNTNTAYTVKHFLQNIDGTYPSEPEETDNLTGTTGASVTPAVKSYPGFTAPATQTATISADGSLVITYQYTRNSYTLTWDANGGELSGDYTTGSVKYGAPITPPTAIRDGYDFAGWNETPATTMPAEAKTYTAQWTEEPGEYLDIVDAADNSITINMTPFPLSGWPYQVNEVVYRRTISGEGTPCNADRTITISHSAAPGDPLIISVKNGAGYATELSRHNYYVPFVYESDATLSGTNSKSIVFVRNGVLTVNGEQTAKAIYVAPEAELNIAQGGTLTVEKLVLRTSPWSAAILTKTGTLTATKVYYSRQVADNSGYFQFGLPLSTTCNVNAVTLSDGSTPTYGSAWMLKSYSESLRAENGAADDPETRNNWVMLAGTQPVSGSVGYEMYSASKYYREFYFPVSLNQVTTSVRVFYTADGAAGSAHAGWNIICSPLTSRYSNTDVDPVQGLKVSWLQDDGSYNQEIPTTIPPAIPFSYQASSTGDALYFNEAPLAQHIAARRTNNSTTETEWIHIDIQDTKGKGDHTSLFAHPDRFEATYETGIDVAKQSLTASRAIIYSSHAYGDMAFAGVADSLLESGVALTVYSPKSQELTFSLRDNDWLNRMESVWLIDKQEGMRLNLLNGYYTFNAPEGTTRGRFFIQGQFKAPNIATKLEPVSDSSSNGTKARKVLIGQKMYIIVNDQMFDATGKQVTK